MLQTFSPPGTGKRLIDIVDEALDQLSDRVSVADKKALVDAVRDHIRVLVKDHLPGYLVLEDDILKPKKLLSPHSRAREAVARAIKEWAGQAQPRPLESFPERS